MEHHELEIYLTFFSLPTVTHFDLLLVHSSKFNCTKSSNLKI